ncbi:hypothetical protein BSFA1_11040 [Burkholderia sp. SFA1]|nr:hypothetical protein BSFA1_11040 [Burkholderia sp. SFA1]
MAFGLECYDESGNPVLRITDRITRLGGQFDTGTSDGSFSVPMFSGGTPFINVRDADPYSTTTMCPTVTISGTTVTWSFGSGTLTHRSVNVKYGVF